MPLNLTVATLNISPLWINKGHTHKHTYTLKCGCFNHCRNFNQMVGTYEELQSYLKEYVEELSRSDKRRNAL